MVPFALRAAALAAALSPLLAAAAPLTLAEALQLATERSESARGARAAVTSAAEASRAAGQLPDPVLGVSVENLPVTGADRFSTTRESMTMKRIGLTQEWLSPEKRSLRAAAANAAVAREGVALAASKADTRVQAALAYVDAYYAAEALQLAVQNEAHAREAMETARVRLAAGSGGAQDVLGLASAQGMAEDETADLRQQLASADIQLSRWTGRPAGQLIAPSLPEAVDQQVFVDAFPAVVAKQREIDSARRDADVASANRRPNWSWQVAYGQRSGFSDLVSVGVTIPLPVAPAARQDRETAARLALVDKAEAELAEATRAAQAEYDQLTTEQHHHVHRIARYRAAVLAPAAQRTTAALAGYRSNQSTLAMVFDARHAELEARRKLLAMERELARMRAQLTYKPVRAEDLQ